MPAAPDLVLKSLADPTRRAIFERLSREGESNVRVLTQASRISQPAISKHLRILREAGLVRDRRDGRETHYAAEPRALAPLIDWMSAYAGFWQQKFDRLEDLLGRMDP